MADKNRDEELPQRVRGAARLSPARSAPSPALSDELRHRMQAAVEAERAEVRQHGRQPDQAATPPAAAAANGDVTSAVVSPGRSTGNGKPAVAEAPARDRRPLAAEPAVDDEVTEWLGQTAGPKTGRAQAARAKPAVPRGQAPPPAPVPPKPRRRAHLTWLAVLASAA